MGARKSPYGELKGHHRFAVRFVTGSFLAFASPAPADAQRVIYVSENAPGTSDGTSWANAYQDLQDALDDTLVSGGCPCEVWITAGVYKPDRGTGDRGIAFEPPGNVALYGGFVGWEECLDDRDWGKNETILSGDLAGDDALAEAPTSTCCTSTRQPGCDDQECADTISALVPYCAARWYFDCPYVAQTLCCDLCRPMRCENSFNVVRVQEAASVRLDALVIEGGEGAGEVPGAGVWARDSTVSMRNCTFRKNAGGEGCAAYFKRGAAVIENCVFRDNDGYANAHPVVFGWESSSLDIAGSRFARNRGGAIRLHDGVHVIEDCIFLENQSTGSSPGIFVDSVAEAEIDGCSFVRNVGHGGCGVSNDGFSRVTDCSFIGNLAAGGGAAIANCGALIAKDSAFVGNRAGGFVFYPYEEPQDGFAGGVNNACGGAAFANCTFVGNSAGNVGGLWAGTGADVVNCLFWNNRHEGYPPEQTGQISGYSTASIDIDYSIVQGWIGSLGGLGNSGADPMFVDADGADDVAGTDDDNLRLSPGSPAINAGDPNTTGLPATDLDGHARVLCDRVDIGAYEFGIGDYNCDQTVDLFDFVNWSSCMTGPSTADTAVPQGCEAFDFNADGAIDLRDFAGFQGSDF